MQKADTIETLIGSWPTLSDFARDAGVSYGAAKQMRRRKSIGVAYWRSLVGSDKGREIGLTADDLARLHERQDVPVPDDRVSA